LLALRTLQTGEPFGAPLALFALFALRAGQALLTGLADDAPRSRTARKALVSWFALRASLARQPLGPPHTALAAWSLLARQPSLADRALITGRALLTGQADWTPRALVALLAGPAGRAGQALWAFRSGFAFQALRATPADWTFISVFTDRSGQSDRALRALVAHLPGRPCRSRGSLITALTGWTYRPGRTLRAAVTGLDRHVHGHWDNDRLTIGRLPVKLLHIAELPLAENSGPQ